MKNQSDQILNDIENINIVSLQQQLHNIHEKRLFMQQVDHQTVLSVLKGLYDIIQKLYGLQSETARFFDIDIDDYIQKQSKSVSFEYLKLESSYFDVKNRTEKLAIQMREAQQQNEAAQKQSLVYQKKLLEEQDKNGLLLDTQKQQLIQLQATVKQQTDQIKIMHDSEVKNSQLTKNEFLQSIDQHLKTIEQLRKEKDNQQFQNKQLIENDQSLKQQLLFQQQSMKQLRENHENQVAALKKETQAVENKYSMIKNEIDDFVQKLSQNTLEINDDASNPSKPSLESKVARLMKLQLAQKKAIYENQLSDKQTKYDVLQQELNYHKNSQQVLKRDNQIATQALEDKIQNLTSQLQELKYKSENDNVFSSEQNASNLTKQMNQQLQNDNKFLRQQIIKLSEENEQFKVQIASLQNSAKAKYMKQDNGKFQMRIPSSSAHNFQIVNRDYDEKKKNVITVTRPWKTTK